MNIAKLFKKTTENPLFVVDFTTFLGDGDSIATINSCVASSGVTLTNAAITAVNYTIGFEIQRILSNPASNFISDFSVIATQNPPVLLPITIVVGKGVQFNVSSGTNYTEYLITINVTTLLGIVIEINVVLVVADIITDYVNGVKKTPVSYYGSVFQASDYFFGDPIWTTYQPPAQLLALIKATRAIDRLNFLGYKTDPNQINQFPRTDWSVTPTVNADLIIPNDIYVAAYEEAYLLIQGFDPNEEQVDLSTTSEGIGSARVTYNRAWVATNIRSGIMSSNAWNYLKPYLRDSMELDLQRVT